jgi:hypothetical protein
MKKNEVPQEKSFLNGYTRDIYYARNNEGVYETELSSGWDVKHDALIATWEDIKARAEEALEEVKAGKQSPIHYFMIVKVMDISILSSYTGIRRRAIRRHLKPSKFNSLSQEKLLKYAEAFDISLNELKDFTTIHEQNL